MSKLWGFPFLTWMTLLWTTFMEWSRKQQLQCKVVIILRLEGGEHQRNGQLSIICINLIFMSNPSDPLNEELGKVIGEHLASDKNEHPDEEQDRLIAKEQPQERPNQPQPLTEAIDDEPDHQDGVIDPFHELIKNNDVVPLLAVIDKLDLTTIVEGKPLLSRLCTMHIPLTHLLAGRNIEFTKDVDNRTALHEAIAADDVASAHWCLQNNIGNHRDNFGNTPLLEAIRLGRKACFLLCLHYEYFDSEAAHACAIYNRAWQFKILHQLRGDLPWQRDSQHMTPLERAVQNYSYDVAEYLTEASGPVDLDGLAQKTDSKGILRLISRINKQNSLLSSTILPIALLLGNLLVLYYASGLPAFIAYQHQIELFLGTILILYFCLYASAWATVPERAVRSSLISLLKAPQFPPLGEICPHCMRFQEVGKQHCLKCGVCVPKLHFHELVCVNKNNQIFWLLIQVFWFSLVYFLNTILSNSLQTTNAKILALSNNIFFGNAAIIDYLFSSQQYLLLWVFCYLKVFLVYQFCCLFQWGYMLVLNRSYREANHSERYTRLYRVGQANDGSYKSQEIRLMEKGFVKGVFAGLNNAIMYFFR